ncbi:thiolase-like protein [Apiosordaria backusii]|uniref:Thiolase-like protein n=1 Tax=Apiosordaria backusii TaxID=314023 RepID=A0AA40DKI2_9PEZI|nr:thiolase-like protein [Apiosordaria backusii]
MSVQTEPRELGLSILGLGIQYPPHSLDARAIEVLSKRYHPDSPAMQKVLAINRYTGIEKRSSIGQPDHWVVNQPSPPTISQLHEIFMSDGVPLAISASQKAMAEAHIDDVSQITHMVSTTCTDSANPGYDHFVAKSLGLSPSVEKVLLHGVGCSGGLAALRTAANICLGHSMRGLPARILVLALEVSTTMVRSELESIHQDQETRIGVCLFSDCASAVILSNDIPFSAAEPIPPPVYSLLDWRHQTVPDTEQDLGFDTHPHGWKVVLTPRVPEVTKGVLVPTYNSLLSGTRTLPEGYDAPRDFDWAMHPGGATILTGAEKALGIEPEHMRASYDTYINHGNSSSATIFSVLDRLRQKDMDGVAPGGRGPKEMVVGCAFGPGITVEMCLLKRNLNKTEGRKGMETPPETESSSEDGEMGSDEGGTDSGEGEQRQETGKDREEAFIEKALESVELD